MKDGWIDALLWITFDDSCLTSIYGNNQLISGWEKIEELTEAEYDQILACKHDLPYVFTSAGQIQPCDNSG